MITAKEKIIYQFNVYCPSCNRKLMVLNLSNYQKPVVHLLEKKELGVHNAETRCHICKSFVAIDLTSKYET